MSKFETGRTVWGLRFASLGQQSSAGTQLVPAAKQFCLRLNRFPVNDNLAYAHPLMQADQEAAQGASRESQACWPEEHTHDLQLPCEEDEGQQWLDAKAMLIP